MITGILPDSVLHIPLLSLKNEVKVKKGLAFFQIKKKNNKMPLMWIRLLTAIYWTRVLRACSQLTSGTMTSPDSLFYWGLRIDIQGEGLKWQRLHENDFT